MEESIRVYIRESAQWLKKIQNAEDGGWGEYQGAKSSCLNTSEAIIALVESGCHKAGDRVIQKGAKYLIENQLNGENSTTTEDCGAWVREFKRGKKAICIPDTVRTSFALLALNTAGRSCEDKPVELGIKWLLKTQNKDGKGWGYRPNSENSLFPTCLALEALLRMYSAGEEQSLKSPIQDVLDHILSYRNDDGSFGKMPGLVATHTLHVICVFQMASDLDFNIPRKEIESAKNWIRNNKDQTVRWSNETIRLEKKENSPANYTFSHLNPAMYLRVFGEKLFPEDDIGEESLIVLDDNIDPVTHAFCAKRPVSWATAKALMGLAKMPSLIKDKEFPVRKSQSVQPQGRHYIFGFLAILVLASAVLEGMGKLSMTFASVTYAVILALLLVYGYISEKSFVKLFIRRLKQKK